MTQKSKHKKLARHLQKTFATAAVFDHSMDEEAWRDGVEYKAPKYGACLRFVATNMGHAENMMKAGSSFTLEQSFVAMFAVEVRSYHERLR